MTNQPLISACLIVKNEADLLADCLASIESLVEEIVVVDTGSTDNTLEIAQKMDATVYQQQWQDNFALARNCALDRAHGKWIMVIDADERLPRKFHQQLLTTLKPKIEGIYLKIKNYYGHNNRDNFVFDSACRLFRNCPQYRYQSPLHEEMSKNILNVNPNAKIIDSNIYLEHLGYLDTVIKTKNKSQRNQTILKKAIKKQPDNPFLIYALGTEYFQQQQFRKALTYYHNLLELNLNKLDFAADLIYKTSVAYLELKQLEQGIRLVENGLKIFPDFQALWFIKGELYLYKNNPEAARLAYQTTLEIKNNSRKYIILNGLTSFRTNFAIGKTYEIENNLDKALKYYLQAYRENPDYQPAYQRLLVIWQHKKENITQYLDLNKINIADLPLHNLINRWINK